MKLIEVIRKNLRDLMTEEELKQPLDRNGYFVSRQTLHGIMHKYNYVSTKVLEQLAGALSIEIVDLFKE